MAESIDPDAPTLGFWTPQKTTFDVPFGTDCSNFFENDKSVN